MKMTQDWLEIAREIVVAKEHIHNSRSQTENTDAHMTGELRNC